VHHHVVGMSVVAVPVVADQGVGVLLVEDVGESASRLVGIGVHEGARSVVLRPAGHPGVVVAEPFHPCHPEGARGGLQLAAATR